MAIDQDPYRTLGLSRGASIEEIKRAYRRLAKIHHPDAAGEKNVPRFLAIQAAYEQLAGGLEGRGATRRPAAAPRQPWDADPDRSDATRRAYGGRARGPAPGGSKASDGATAGGSGGRGSAAGSGPAAGPGPAPGASAKAGPQPRPGSARPGRRGTGTNGRARSGTTGAGAADSSTGSGTAGTSPGAGPSDAPPRGPRERKRNKATLGSTSYDGVDGPFEPDWRGASWYGTTSGTYWTLNPKEYADPRKHGPEYQARARRATRVRPSGTPDPTDTPGAAAAEDQADARPPESAAPGPSARPTHTTSSWWESTAGATGPAPDPAAAAAAAAAERPARPDSPPTPVPPPPDIGRAMADIGRALTDPTFGGNRGRAVRAILGWLPIAFGVSWLVGEITGCGRFAATCNGAVDPLVMVVEVVALALLLLLPSVASIAAMGAISLLGAAVVAALILSATGSAADGDSRRSVLGAVLLVAWLVGVGVAVAKRLRPPSSTTRPVS